MGPSIPTVVLGGSGYVAGELLRLIAGHPHFSLAGVLSDSQPGERVAQAFGHLAPVLPEERFRPLSEIEAIVAREDSTAIFSAAPHGAAAALIDSLLCKAEAAQRKPHVVDISADYRYRSADAYQAVYKHPHGAPQRICAFSCAVPEHLPELTTAHVAHPGCYATAALLASVPLLALSLSTPELFVSAVTGSTGSGRKPGEGTHHPLRHGDLYSYGGLTHRHTPEITACARAASGVDAQFAFIPHSGPFARGIHATVQARLRQPLDTAQLLAALRRFYQGKPFVRVSDTMPRVKEVAGSNYAQLSGVSDGRTVAVMCALDNLNKGAAGGAVQWMNRLYGLAETAGLTAPAAGWT
ncbi:MAG TPA: N-acetyl-gamma-glutamyl-phosphate reductase [Steroidobacteraceae bacterium]|jgi:N-acetyl-gamma-glutamyl-phosphate reductase common form|nr:N-acetyl-gamma-glutamyl-phosphate reductase [Steroidobacteraceae bacterium]